MKTKSILLAIPALLGLFLSACGGDGLSNGGDGSSDSLPQAESSQSSSALPSKKDFTGVSFESLRFVYDGEPHILAEVQGAPEETMITYEGRKEYTDVGSYAATATLSKEGYNEKTLSAVLAITKATMEGYTYESKRVTYDGADHFNDIQLIGVLPEGTRKEETVKDSSGAVVTQAKEVGTYTYTCVLSNKNYNTETLNATLTIQAKKKNLPVFASEDGDVYFANGLDRSYLYSWSSEGVNLLDYSSPTEFKTCSDSSALYLSKSLFSDSAKKVKGNSLDILYTDSDMDDFVSYDDHVSYYSRNALQKANSGIYKVDASLSGAEPILTKVFEGKSDNLSLYNDELYFINESDHDYVYKMNPSTKKISLVMEASVHEFTIAGGRLYGSINGLTNDYLGYLDLSGVSSKPTKLTNAAGEFLTVKGGYLYYSYADWLSYTDSSLKGVWRISTQGGDPVQLVSCEGICGFDVKSSSLFYVDASNFHLYRYNTSTHAKEDLLQGFVAPERTPLNMGGRTISLGTKTYFLNMYAGKTLYVYDESTRQCSQLTANKVEDFYIDNGVMYFNQVTMFTNNDLYAVDLKKGGEAEKVSTNDVRGMVSDGVYLYAVHYNWAGAAGGLSRMKLDGSEYVKFSDINGAKNLVIRDGKLYFINCSTGQDNGSIESIDLASITSESENLKGVNLSKEIKNVKQFVLEGNDIFYLYNGTIDNSVRRSDFNTLGEGVKLASSKTNPSEFILNGRYVYYYSYATTATSYAGFYRVSKQATGDGTQELLAGYDSKYYGSSFSISESGNLYFLNYIPKLLKGDAHFYQMNLKSYEMSKIA